MQINIKFKQDRLCTYKSSSETRLCNHCCRGKVAKCVFVALGIQHAKCMRVIILSSAACLTLPYFSHIIS